LQEAKNIHRGKAEESTKKSKSFLDMSMERVIKSSKFFGKNDYEEVWSREEVEKICQVQIGLNKAEIELEVVKKILERIENHKEQLDQQLEARIEVLSK
jgi:hypothetical protein